MSFEDLLVHKIPLAEASAYFIGLKKIAAPSPEALLQEFASMSKEAQLEILQEAGVSPEEVPEEVSKTASAKPSKKLAYAERMLPGTEHYHSDRMREMLDQLPARVFTPSSVEEKYASAFKIALEQTSDMQQYLAQEQEGMQGQEQAEVQYLRQKMQEMQMQQQSASSGQQQTAQQMQVLEQQIAQSQASIAAANQSAMEAQTMASSAQQAQLSSTDEALRNAQLAAQMRMAYQQLRSQMMDIASQDPAAGLAEQLKGQMPGAQGLGPEGVSPGAPPGGDPAAAGGAPAAGGEQPPTQGPPSPEQGPANQAVGAQPTPDAAPAEGETGATNAKADGEKPKTDGAKPALQIGIKQANAAAIGALAGGALGAASTRYDAGNTEGLKGKVSKLESDSGGGFMKALNLAQSKARLALSEVAEKHPTASAITGGLLGAGAGAGAGASVANLLKR